MKTKSVCLLRLLFVSGLLAILPSCSKTQCDCAEMSSPGELKKETPDATSKPHVLKGVVKAVNNSEGTLLVAHEEVKDVMPAMTMAYKVDASVVQSAKSGDVITGKLVRDGNAWTLENVKTSTP